MFGVFANLSIVGGGGGDNFITFVKSFIDLLVCLVKQYLDFVRTGSSL